MSSHSISISSSQIANQPLQAGPKNIETTSHEGAQAGVTSHNAQTPSPSVQVTLSAEGQALARGNNGNHSHPSQQ